jgi:hypothetical protein
MTNLYQAADVQVQAANNETTETGTMSKVQVNNNLSLTLYKCEGFDFSVGVLKFNSKVCNLYYYDNGKFTLISGLKRNDGQDLTDEDVLSNIRILFGG